MTRSEMIQNFKKQNFYNNLTYPCKSLSEDIIVQKRQSKLLKTGKTNINIVFIIIGTLYLLYNKNYDDPFNIFFVPLMVFFCILFLEKFVGSKDNTFKALKTSLETQLKGKICTCNSSCNCKNSFYEYMHKNEKIKLY